MRTSLATVCALHVVAWSHALAQVYAVPSQCGHGTYDRGRDRVVMRTASGGSLVTQLFDGNTLLSLGVPTPVLVGGQAAYDVFNQVIVAPSTMSDETYEWDGAMWQLRGVAPFWSGSSVPSAATHAEFLPTYHAGRRRVVGARPGTVNSGIDLVEWDGAAWRVIPTTGAPPTNPPALGWYRYGPLVYDGRSKKLVLHSRTQLTVSGSSASSAQHAWEWDHATGWVQTVTAAVTPGAGPLAYLWFDEQRGRIVKYALTSASSWSLTWRRDDGSWAPIGAPASGGGLVAVSASSYDPARQRVYGLSQSGPAYLTDAHPADYVWHGTGCSASQGPRLSLTNSWTRAWRGQTLSVQVHPAPQSFAVLATGFSDQAYGSVTLPLSLTTLGLPGCHLRVAPEHLQVGLAAGATVRFDQVVPNVPPLVGVVFWHQAFTMALGANPAGVLVSDSMRGRIGKAD